jgi:hypothetical protein
MSFWARVFSAEVARFWACESMTWDGAFWLVMVVLITMNLGLKWWTRRRDAQDEADRRFYRCRRRTFLRAREERYEELLRPFSAMLEWQLVYDPPHGDD